MSLQDAQEALQMLQEAKDEGDAAELTFKRRVPGQYDPATGGSTDVEVTWTGIAVVLPASQGTVQAFDVKFENGTLVESTLRGLLIAAHGMQYEPGPGDRVAFPDGSTATLLGCTPLNPDAANPIIYQATAQL